MKITKKSQHHQQSAAGHVDVLAGERVSISAGATVAISNPIVISCEVSGSCLPPLDLCFSPAKELEQLPDAPGLGIRSLPLGVKRSFVLLEGAQNAHEQQRVDVFSTAAAFLVLATTTRVCYNRNKY